MPTEYDIAAAFEAIENELIASMMRNMKRHRAEEDAEGIRWSQWQAEQLQALAEYKRHHQAKCRKQFRSINRDIEMLLREAKRQGGMEQEEAILRAIRQGATLRPRETLDASFFRINQRKLDALIKATTDDIQRAETAVLRRANDQYRKIIFNAQVYANTGAGTYEKAVDMAAKDFLSAGIQCVVYANGARHTLSDYAEMAIRTASKRAYLQGEGEKRQEWGISTVILNKRGNACPLCAPFCGKVFIDDVWSGGKAKDGPYPLLSGAIAKGLYHPRCKDSHTTFFPEISEEGSPWTAEERKKLAQDYNREQKQRHAERQAKKYDRLSAYSLDEENRRRYAARSDEWKTTMSRKNSERHTSWEIQSNPITKEQFDELNEAADQAGVRLMGFEHYDGDVELIHESIRDIQRVLNDFPEVRKKPVVLRPSYNMHDYDYAMTQNRTITINANAFNNRKALERDYKERADTGWFVRGTDYRSIIYHEMGHVVTNVKKVPYSRVFKEILVEDIGENISDYAVENPKEAIAEAISSYYSGKRNEIVLRVLRECGIIK